MFPSAHEAHMAPPGIHTSHIYIITYWAPTLVCCTLGLGVFTLGHLLMCPLPNLVGSHVVHAPFHSISPGHDWLSFLATPTLFFQDRNILATILPLSKTSRDWVRLPLLFLPKKYRHTRALINPLASNVPVYYLPPCPKSSCLFGVGDNSFLRPSFFSSLSLACS